MPTSPVPPRDRTGAHALTGTGAHALTGTGTGRGRHRRGLAVVTALAVLAVGCAALRTGPDRPHASAPPAPPVAAPPAAPPLAAPAMALQAASRQELNGPLGYAERESTLRQAALAAQRWGLAAVPLRAPAPPAVKPELADGPGVQRGPGLPPVVYRVPTTDKVVFLTVDDGAEKDPRFTAMAAELGVPLSAFLSDYLARADYGYFRAMHAQGDAINNHTINHPDLRRLGPDALRHEICDQQDRLEQEVGVRPRLFRPPYGEYTEAALRTAASCGITAVPLWNEEAFPDRIEYRYGDHKLHPGDIVLTHFRAPAADWKGEMPDMLRRVLDTATAQGFAVARLEDYL